MHYYTRNVNTGFYDLANIFYHWQEGHTPDVPIAQRPSRNGTVWVFQEPFTLTYEKPIERVLFNKGRNANPFMHLYESLWMFAGSNKVKPMAYYAKQMLEYTDDGKTLNGAYGYRWRNATRYDPLEKYDFKAVYEHGEDAPSGVGYAKRPGGVDQLLTVANHLKGDPNSRRAVLNMWNVQDDLLKIGQRATTELKDTNNPGYRGEMVTGDPGSKDVCCNLECMFMLRESLVCSYCQGGKAKQETTAEGSCVACLDRSQLRKQDAEHYLDMTVTNRSNDLVWGMLGANAVHFSFLLEYMAARIGAKVGKYHHFTNNMHVYSWNWKPVDWLNDRASQYAYHRGSTATQDKPIAMIPLVNNPERFDEEVVRFVNMNWYQDHQIPGEVKCHKEEDWQERFLAGTAQPMCNAWHMHKKRNYDAATYWLDRVEADDWRLAGQQFMDGLRKGYEGQKLYHGKTST